MMTSALEIRNSTDTLMSFVSTVCSRPACPCYQGSSDGGECISNSVYMYMSPKSNPIKIS